MQAKILVIDDEEHIRRILRAILTANNYHVVLAASGTAGLEQAVDQVPDLIILDMVMPDMHGLEVCKELRNWYTGPVLVLSGVDRTSEKVSAFDAGADDYVNKPFMADELLARVRGLLRRITTLTITNPLITLGDLSVDIARRRVTLAGANIHLTPIEYEILTLLARNYNCVVTIGMLMERAWGAKAQGDVKVLRVHMNNLRKKLDPDATGKLYIQTEPGIGYRFCESTAE